MDSAVPAEDSTIEDVPVILRSYTHVGQIRDAEVRAKADHLGEVYQLAMEELLVGYYGGGIEVETHLGAFDLKLALGK